MDIVVYHNPDCGTSRNTLALIRQWGIEPHVIEYLKTPPSRALLAQLVARMGIDVRDLIRQKGTPYAELGLDGPDLTDDQLLDAMIAHPILINRPIVVSPLGVKLCRPSDVVLDLLPPMTTPPEIEKEEGVPFLKDAPVAPADPALVANLQAANLPADDLAEPGRTFFAYETLDGRPVGFGGYELQGEHVLIRSVVVLPEVRGKRIGRNILPLLLFRAHEAGAKRAWLLTTSAPDFFYRAGFKPVERTEAPASILATRQASSLCPASAVLMTREISF
ncbi:arsenate reductase (glutaredoxin) [Labrys sp. LIt4]|nr:arsenic resistance N-acetyltransferase ArsN2 [Labrys sp. LIt4]MBP0580241.1 arsenate reductase (glutaredoxin) [Labrys sp. LIt4]